MSYYGQYVINESYDTIVEKLRKALDEIKKYNSKIESEKDLKKRIDLINGEIKVIGNTSAEVRKDKVDFTDVFKKHKKGPNDGRVTIIDQNGNKVENEYDPINELLRAILTAGFGACAALLFVDGHPILGANMGLASFGIGYTVVDDLKDIIFKKNKVSAQLDEINKNLEDAIKAYKKCIEKGYKTSDELKKIGISDKNIKDIENTGYIDIWTSITKKMEIKKSSDDFSKAVVLNKSKNRPYCTKGIDMILPGLRKFTDLCKSEIKNNYGKTLVVEFERYNEMNNDTDSIDVSYYVATSDKKDKSIRDIEVVVSKLLKKYMETVYPVHKYFIYDFDGVELLYITFIDTTGTQV